MWNELIWINRNGVPIEGIIFVRPLQYAHQDGSWWLCWNCDCFLSVVPEHRAWWDRLRVLGKQDWTTLHFADQCVHRRERRQRTKDLPLVRSNQGLPHLLCSMEHVPDCVCSLSPSLCLISFFLICWLRYRMGTNDFLYYLK